ncbi:hypothetical protein ACFWF7_00095 [Nocardia sp. NPDC060256]|uniref:hypothetical protein n=1 Tax=unclassified Nocardia TaxID=2637762 RepID=UPI00365EA46D
MTTISFSPAAEDIFSVRKAVYRMIIIRATKELDYPEDIKELEMSELFDDMSLYSLPQDQRARLQAALLAGTSTLRADIITGRPTEEPTLPGINEKLSELIEFIRTHIAA